MSATPLSIAAVAPAVSNSANWAGYVASANPGGPQTGAVTSVSGSWNVPSVTPAGKGNEYSSVFVGIDGVTSPTVEQIGTESDIVNGKPQYSVWYETYPKASVSVAPMKIQPGDTINGAVQYLTSGPHAGQFQLTLTDASQKNSSFTTYQNVPTAQRSSAEWIVETPSSGSGVLPTAGFSPVTFTNASATINGKTGPIDAPSWHATAIHAQSNAGVGALPTVLTDAAAADSAPAHQTATGKTSPLTAASPANASSSFTVVPSIVTGSTSTAAHVGGPNHLLHSADEMLGDASYGGYGYSYGGSSGPSFTIQGGLSTPYFGLSGDSYTVNYGPFSYNPSSGALGAQYGFLGASFSPYSTEVCVGPYFGAGPVKASLQACVAFPYGYSNAVDDVGNGLYSQIPYTDSFYQGYTPDLFDPYAPVSVGGMFY
jgi:hypothetical protein